MTRDELIGIFNLDADTDKKFFSVQLPQNQNPFSDLSNYATADLLVINMQGAIYAATSGVLDINVATEIL